MTDDPLPANDPSLPMSLKIHPGASLGTRGHLEKPNGRNAKKFRSRIRAQIWDRDSVGSMEPRIACMWCRKLLKRKEFTIEHITRMADGGGWDLGNLGAACAKCNNERHAH